MTEWLEAVNRAVWGAPLLLLLFFCGVILSLRTRFFQLRHTRAILKTLTGNQKSGGITPRQSVACALAGTLGTGNIVGVAGAITLGGPGAVFWMWVCAIFSMIVKFAEIALSVRYRERMRDGTYAGGTMYIIKNALPHRLRFLGAIFAACGSIAAFGIGNLTQINTLSYGVMSVVRAVGVSSTQTEVYIKLVVGVVCAVALLAVLWSDAKIGAFCERLIPIATLLYFVMTAGVILRYFYRLPQVFIDIFTAAFSPSAITGGAVGSAFIGLRFGMSRGIFSNEAGMGTAPIAYSCAEGSEAELGLLGVFEVFVDTIVVCTLTALSVLCVGGIVYGQDTGAALALSALSSVWGKGAVFAFAPSICIFAFSSTVGWGLYGARFVTFLLGSGAKKPFLVLFCLTAVWGALFRADTVWLIAEILNGIMAIPNTIVLLLLSNDVADITEKFEC